MKHLLLLGFSTLLLLASCKKKDSVPTSHPVSGSEATIGWQDCATYTDHDLTICFIGANDYRCPCNTECVWEGAVDATLHITNSTGLDTTITLTTNSNPTGLHSQETVGDKIIRFVNTTTTQPYDCATDQGNYEKYKVIIAVE